MNIDQLRGELRDFNQYKFDLHKWKIITVGVLGAAGIGLSSKKDIDIFGNTIVIVALIPFIVAYRYST